MAPLTPFLQNLKKKNHIKIRQKINALYLKVWNYQFQPAWASSFQMEGTSKWLNWSKSYYTETLKKHHFQILWAPSFQTGMGRTSIFNPRLYIVCSKNHCVEISWKSINWNKSYCKETDVSTDGQQNHIRPQTISDLPTQILFSM